MPILIVAMVALAVFGIIGVLLLTAMVLEHRMHNKHSHALGMPAAPLPLIKH